MGISSHSTLTLPPHLPTPPLPLMSWLWMIGWISWTQRKEELLHPKIIHCQPSWSNCFTHIPLSNLFVAFQIFKHMLVQRQFTIVHLQRKVSKKLIFHEKIKRVFHKSLLLNFYFIVIKMKSESSLLDNQTSYFKKYELLLNEEFDSLNLRFLCQFSHLFSVQIQ